MKRALSKFLLGLFLLVIITAPAKSLENCDGTSCSINVGQTAEWNNQLVELEGIDGTKARIQINEFEAGEFEEGQKNSFRDKEGRWVVFNLRKISADYIIFDIGPDESLTTTEVRKEEPASCKDSDGGVEPYKYGEVITYDSSGKEIESLIDSCGCNRQISNDITIPYPESCGGYSLREYYCEGKEAASMEIMCDYGCFNWYCVSYDDPNFGINAYDLGKGLLNMRVEGFDLVFESAAPFAEFYLDEKKVNNVEIYQYPGELYTKYWMPCPKGEKLEAYGLAGKRGTKIEEYSISQKKDFITCAEERLYEEDRQKREKTGELIIGEKCSLDEGCISNFCEEACQKGGFFKKIIRWIKNLF